MADIWVPQEDRAHHRKVMEEIRRKEEQDRDKAIEKAAAYAKSVFRR